MSKKTKHSMEKLAYTAVGAPIAAVKAVSARVSELRDTIRESRGELTEELADEFDSWVREGERVVGKALEHFRETGAVDRARATTRMIREKVEASIDELTETAIVEPDDSLQLIRGIGPTTAARLGDAGVDGIASFLDMTATQRGIDDLASASGHRSDTIAGWRRQVDLTRVSGIGESYQRLLHRLDVWTMDQLAAADPSVLSSEVRSVAPRAPDHLPGESLLSEWIGEAKTLAAG